MRKPSVPLLIIVALLLGAGAGGALAYGLLAPHQAAVAKTMTFSLDAIKNQVGLEPGTRARYPGAHPAPTDPVPLYLDLMKRSLTDAIYEIRPRSLEAMREGRGWPSRAHTMIGFARLDSLQAQVEDVLRAGVPGDLIECGAWRGGATILMRAVLKAHGVTNRKVWVADSFEGLPPPDPAAFPADRGDVHNSFQMLAVSLERVKDNFASYGLLDGQVEFLKGWFKDTLPKAKIDRLAVLRIDGDMYESTMEALDSLYAKVSPGGYVIIDDAVSLPACKQAVDDFRAAHRITAELKRIDQAGAYWQKP
jgi:hypothetical protein